MAASWIKVEVITPDKPEVFQLSEVLELDPDAVLGKLVRLWAWADQQTIDGNAKCNAVSVTKNAIDRIAFVTGFADAMLGIGWLAYEGEILVFPNFERHNGNSSKKRALTNSRVTKSRQVKRTSNADSNAKGNAPNVTGAYQKALPEVEEEEEVKDKTISLGGEEFFSADGDEFPPLGKFVMCEGWKPSQEFKRQAALWGRLLEGAAPGYELAELNRFIGYWQAEGKAFTQTQWEMKFADSVVHERRAAAKKPAMTGGANATRNSNTAGLSTAQQQVRDARNAERRGQGLAPLGDDGRDLRYPLGEQERRVTDVTLGDDDYSVLG